MTQREHHLPVASGKTPLPWKRLGLQESRRLPTVEGGSGDARLHSSRITPLRERNSCLCCRSKLSVNKNDLHIHNIIPYNLAFPTGHQSMQIILRAQAEITRSGPSHCPLQEVCRPCWVSSRLLEQTPYPLLRQGPPRWGSHVTGAVTHSQ